MKKLREKLANKKGFTLVELIVVIVIILVLSAVLVPNVIKYIEKANKANCKSDAATILTQLQANYADQASEAAQNGSAFTFSASTINGKSLSTSTIGSSDSIKQANSYAYALSGDDDDVHISVFAYASSGYFVRWTEDGGWTEPTKLDK